MAPYRLLLADDESAVRTSLRIFFEKRDFLVQTVQTGAEAIQRLREADFDAVLTDLKMPGGDGMDVVRFARTHSPDVAVVVMSGYAEVDNAVEAMRVGALDYVRKPFDVDELHRRVRDAITRARAIAGAEATETAAPARPPTRELGLPYAEAESEASEARVTAASLRLEGEHEMIGRHAEMRRLFALIERVAPADATVLITGESGTGKELIAREIHRRSPRARGPWVPVNCGAIPEALLEDELFGHVKGAFTGASGPRAGCFALADHGTLFLDEIGEMSASLQVKLLRVLQERCFMPVGGSRYVHVDFRVIAATNKDLEEECARGHFREDLFYRINVLPITVPPLRQRRSDIPILVESFIAEFNRDKACSIDRVSVEAMHALTAYHWPGNVRQLKNIVQRVVILKGTGSIDVDDLPADIVSGQQTTRPTSLSMAQRSMQPPARAYHADGPSNGGPSPGGNGGWQRAGGHTQGAAPASTGTTGNWRTPAARESPTVTDAGIDLNRVVNDFETGLIRQALEITEGNKNRAAKLLGVKRTTLVEKIKKGKIEPARAKGGDGGDEFTEGDAGDDGDGDATSLTLTH